MSDIDFDELLTDEIMSRIENYCADGQQMGGRFNGMKFEDGIIYMVDYLKGNMTLEELLEGER